MNKTTPLVKIKFTQSPAPWMKQFDIADLQKKRNNYRILAYHPPTEEN